jgi:indolepyruvate ferredoxin oxidoreductase beta subunit
MKFDVLVAGVGGQGTVLASRLLAMIAIDAGNFARTAETFGMAQRGGPVVSHVRIGGEESGPVIPFGCADLLIAFEPSEAARNISRLSSSGKCIVNDRFIKPVTASLGMAPYSEDEIREFIRETVPGAVFIDGYNAALRAGSSKAVNAVMLGASISKGFIPFEPGMVERAIAGAVPEKYKDLNIRAFNEGLEYKYK